MDWDIMPLAIILALQSLAVIGVSLLLIAESYKEKNEIRGRSASRHPGRASNFERPKRRPSL
ncbi:hypothetical protein [Hyphomicrobium sp.]|jgi:hypothetical protein|uniref:hypothetical protein n=1 Tax=Hyphomicrobium sp. TaxID=82 RepID=UPI002B562C5F|nr:hypothetical protein [Hyphomicrobium sp.]HVZ05001.1 hypothetical protein [Hyphomicrobium sp.]